MKQLTKIVFALALTSACGSEPEPARDVDAGTDCDASACGSEGEPARGAGSSSDCGGFGEDTWPRASATTGDAVAGAYCDASMLYWTYDVDTTTLRLRHTRTEMNCGAIPSVDLRLDGGVFQIIENEVLDTEPYGCKCVFDFDVRLEEIPPDVVALEIWQRAHFEPEGKGTRLWSGTLDVSPGAGELVLDASETPWCD